MVLIITAFATAAGFGGAASAHAARASSATVIEEHLAGYGTVLATSSGQVLFMLTDDPPDASKCSGSCTTSWHPLIDASPPTAGPGVNRSLLSTFRRSNGTKQVAYDKHGLYTSTESDPGAAAGTLGEGGIWYLVSPSGQAVTHTSVGGY